MAPTLRRPCIAALVVSVALFSFAVGPGGAQEHDRTASVLFSDQVSNGRILLIDAVRTTHGGFVVVHDDQYLAGERVASILGASGAIGAGMHTDLPVTLDRGLEVSQTVVAVVHIDSNDNQVFDPPRADADPPYTIEGRAVGDTAVVTLPSAPAEEPLPMWPFLGLAAVAFVAIGVGLGGGRLRG